jgi:hypothetical protein
MMSPAVPAGPRSLPRPRLEARKAARGHGRHAGRPGNSPGEATAIALMCVSPVATAPWRSPRTSCRSRGRSSRAPIFHDTAIDTRLARASATLTRSYRLCSAKQRCGTSNGIAWRDRRHLCPAAWRCRGTAAMMIGAHLIGATARDARQCRLRSRPRARSAIRCRSFRPGSVLKARAARS